MADGVFSPTAPKSLDVGAQQAGPSLGTPQAGHLLKPWTLPARGLAVFHGTGNIARLSHYFLPRLLLQGKRVLILDGANCADPRLLERLARQRGVPFAQFNQQVQIARAFTCFQLTELIARVPRLLRDFPAEVIFVTAFPELYFDEDVRDWDARVAFEQALRNLQRWGSQPVSAKAFAPTAANLKVGATAGGYSSRQAGISAPLSIAVFSSAPDFAPPPARRRFFAKTCEAAAEVWKFELSESNRLELSLEMGRRARLPQGLKPLGKKVEGLFNGTVKTMS